MAQLVTRIDADLEAAVDALVEAGVVESRSDAVRAGLRVLVDRHRRQQVGGAIRRGYEDTPQDDDLWPDTATVAMIAEEPW